jgi:amino acid adenylation domain-containing protein
MDFDLNTGRDLHPDREIRAKDGACFPLSFPQQRMWFLGQLLPHIPLYNVNNVFELNGSLHIETMRQSLAEIVRRHEALRTTFRVIEQQPLQVIAPGSDFVLFVRDLTELPSAEREIEASEFVNQESRRLFSLETGPLFRASLLRLSEDKHILLLNLHHIVCDGWSIRNLFQELSVLYNAFSLGQPSPLPKVEFQYPDFAKWQRTSLQGESIEKQLNYWRRQLADCPSILKLPWDRPRPIVNNYQGNRHTFDLPDSLSDSIIAFTRQHKVTLYITLLAALNAQLSRYSGQQDVVIGTTIANRTRIEQEGMMGIFVNTLVLRTDLNGDPTFLDLLARVRETAMAAYSNHDIPFEKLIEELQPERLPGQTPLFQVLFDFQKDYDEGFNIPGLTVRRLPTDNGTAKLDLTLSILQRKDHMTGTVEYNTAVFDKRTILRMLGHFQILLESSIAHPDRRISTLPLLTPEERHQLLIEWNETKREYPAQTCIHELFEAQVTQRPDATAVVFGSAMLTYDELNGRANQLARCIESIGVAKNALVGVCLERSTEMVIALLAILKAGAAYLPLDPSYPQERLAFMLSDSDAPLLITSQSLVHRIPPTSATTIVLDQQGSGIDSFSKENLPGRATAEDLAYVMYTSGSTGVPKGVCIPHRAVNRLVCNTNYITFSACDRVAQISHSSFDALTFELWGALSNGARLVGISKDVALSPSSLVEQIRKEGITVMFLTTALFNLVVRELPDGFQSVEQVVVGGEALDPRWIREALRNGPPMKLINGYGPTETTTFAITFPIRDVAEEASNIPIGRPISNTRVYILDANREPVPIGVAGEIYIGGDGLALGYLNRPELTAQKFVRDPFSNDPHARLYRTGDIARFLPDGNIQFIGRIDHQIKIRGFRVELEEIEAILAQHAEIEKALVLYTAGSTTGKRLVSYLITRPQASPSADELRDFLKAKLPEYMIPSHFVFVDALPLGPGGKVDRQSLPLPVWGKDPLETVRTSPRGPLEEALAGLWCEILGLTEIGIDDDFFDLGGHSLLATQVISRIRKVFNIDLPLMALFEAPTVRRLSEKIRLVVAPGKDFRSVPISRVSTNQELPLSFSQQRLWFLDQLAPANPFYNVCYPMRARGTLEIEPLRRSLNEIVRRHEILRTTFPTTDGQPMQIVHPELELELAITDLSSLPESEREARSLILVREEARTPFDLAKGPLFRAGLLRLDENDHVLLLNWHHIIFDGWSLSVFWHELTILYQTFLRGRSSPLPELAFQYADFARWQRQRIQGDYLEDLLSYWKKQLAEIPPVLELPADRPRPLIESFRGSTYHFQFPVNLLTSLMELSRREGGTLFMTLLTAFMTLLHRYTGQDDIVVGSPVANRSRNEIENLIGFFVNTLVLKGNFSHLSTFRETFNQIRDVCLQAFAHQDLPFEKLVETMRPERSLSHSPLFQVMFVLQNVPMQLPRLPGLALTEIPVERGTAGFDLKLSMAKSEDGLTGSFEYNTDLFDTQTIIRMTSHFQTLLEGIVADSDQPFSKLPILSAAERKQILVEWNDTSSAYQLDRCIHQVFEEQAARTPDSVALVWKNIQISFAELNRHSNRIAHSLMKAGVKADTVVAICAERSIEVIAGMLGILKAGGAFLPLDPDLPKERLNFLLQDSHAQIVLLQKKVEERISECEDCIKFFLDSDWEESIPDARENPIPNVKPDNLAYLLYTSGSTGLPKAVLGTHRASLNRFQWMWEMYPFQKKEVSCQKTSLSFVDSVWEIFGPLLQGIPTVIVPDKAVHDPRRFTEILVKNRVTRIVLVPSFLAALFESGISAENLPTLKVCICSGEALKPKLCHDFHKRFPGRLLLNLYGSTEVAADVTWHQTASDDSKQLRIPVGRPIANNRIYLLDKYLNPVPVGIPGEVHVAGAGLARGYLDRASTTAEKFISDPFSSEPGALLYKTGDLARYLRDGTIDLIGRIDSQIKVRGYRIEPAEVEISLNRHPGVRQCAISAFQDEIGEKNLVAHIVPSEIPGPSAAELRSFLKRKLPDFMIPSLFVMVEELPLTVSGKVNRKALPAPEQTFITAGFGRDLNEVERQLHKIWKEILPVKSIRITDNFFDLGGHSLLAVRLMAAIEKTSGRKLPLKVLFQAPTIEQLASILQQQGWPGLCSSVVQIQTAGSKPPLFCAPGLGGSVLVFGRLAHLLGKDQPLYGLDLTALNRQLWKSIERMSFHFVTEIRKIQPQGPYYLCGSSFGGLVVFEIAQQLNSLGENVALLALFDTYAKGLPGKNVKTLTTFSRLRYHSKFLSLLPWSEKLDYLVKTAKRVFRDEKKIRFRKVKKVGKMAASGYLRRPYSGPITLFRATPVLHPDPKLGWGPLAAGGLEIHDILSSHRILAREASLRVVAPKLRDCLNRAQQRSDD